ncbi:hypothetical protein Tco_0793814 [Tanacetum coccineum]
MDHLDPIPPPLFPPSALICRSRTLIRRPPSLSKELLKSINCDALLLYCDALILYCDALVVYTPKKIRSKSVSVSISRPISLPGDVILDLSNLTSQTIKLGGGLRVRKGMVTGSGSLRSGWLTKDMVHSIKSGNQMLNLKPLSELNPSISHVVKSVIDKPKDVTNKASTENECVQFVFLVWCVQNHM